MKPLLIQATFNTPTVKLDPQKGKFLFEGRSIPEDPGDFFEVILAWIDEYFENPVPVTQVDVKLEYVNSGSSKFFLEIFRRISGYHEAGHECKVTWFFEEEDESIEELGEHYRNTVNLPFELEVIEEEEEEE